MGPISRRGENCRNVNSEIGAAFIKKKNPKLLILKVVAQQIRSWACLSTDFLGRKGKNGSRCLMEKGIGKKKKNMKQTNFWLGFQIASLYQ